MVTPRSERLVWELDWNLLRTFVVIAEVKSITRAAERLNLKQPSVSNALKRLEDRVGRRLVERDATRFDLTEVGQLLYEQAVEVFGFEELGVRQGGLQDGTQARAVERMFVGNEDPCHGHAAALVAFSVGDATVMPGSARRRRVPSAGSYPRALW